MDTRALHHILMHSDIYQKPANLRWGIGQFVGKGSWYIVLVLHRS
jgi:hypothetical protein